MTDAYPTIAAERLAFLATAPFCTVETRTPVAELPLFVRLRRSETWRVLIARDESMLRSHETGAMIHLKFADRDRKEGDTGMERAHLRHAYAYAEQHAEVTRRLNVSYAARSGAMRASVTGMPF